MRDGYRSWHHFTSARGTTYGGVWEYEGMLSYSTRYQIGWNEARLTFYADTHTEYHDMSGEWLEDSGIHTVVGENELDELESAGLVARLAEMGVTVPDDVKSVLAEDDVRARTVAGEYEKAKSVVDEWDLPEFRRELYDEVRARLGQADRVRALKDRLSGPAEVENTARHEVTRHPGGPEAGRELEHLDRPPDSGPDLGGGPDDGLDR